MRSDPWMPALASWIRRRAAPLKAMIRERRGKPPLPLEAGPSLAAEGDIESLDHLWRVLEEQVRARHAVGGSPLTATPLVASAERRGARAVPRVPAVLRARSPCNHIATAAAPVHARGAHACRPRGRSRGRRCLLEIRHRLCRHLLRHGAGHHPAPPAAPLWPLLPVPGFLIIRLLASPLLDLHLLLRRLRLSLLLS